MRFPLNFVLAGVALSSGPSLLAQGATWRDPGTGKVVSMAPAQMGVLEEINFETDSAIVAEGFQSLGCVCVAMRENPDLYLVIEGWADGRGSKEHNRRLSKARADAVMEYLRQSGVPSDRMMALGRGALPGAGGKEMLFQARKVSVVPHSGDFDGPKLESVPVKGDCGGFSGRGTAPVARIESQGNTFLVSVDYAKIRQDFQDEVQRMVRKAATKAAPDVGNVGSAEIRTKLVPVPVPVPVGEKMPVLFRVGILAWRGSLGADNGGATFDGGLLHEYEGGAFQAGITLDTSAGRRKGQGDLALSYKGDGGLVATAIGSLGWVAGAPLNGVTPETRTIVRAGGRVGWAWRYSAAGAGYLSSISPQSSATKASPVPMEPGNLAFADFEYGGPSWMVAGIAGVYSGAIRGAVEYPLATKVMGRVEVGVMLGQVALVAGWETLPLFSTYGDKAERRFLVGFRFGGRTGRERNAWLRLASLREGVAF